MPTLPGPEQGLESRAQGQGTELERSSEVEHRSFRFVLGEVGVHRVGPTSSGGSSKPSHDLSFHPWGSGIAVQIYLGSLVGARSLLDAPGGGVRVC